MSFAHVSVLAEEALQYWVHDVQGLYVDATTGAGGHSRRLLESYPGARLIAVDQDPMALAAAQETLAPFQSRVTFVHGNFRDLSTILDPELRGRIAGFLFDLGVSSPQLDNPERGFSYQYDTALDMRMNPDNPVTAFRLVNMKSKEEIAHALQVWGEERWAVRIADFIVRARAKEPIRTTGQLVELIKAAIPAAARRTGGHPARRTFQALRIWVNDELGALEEGLEAALHWAAPQGRIVVISFHSLEDRIVKHTFRQWGQERHGKVLTRHPISPHEDETDVNQRARSAKLRAFERESMDGTK
ncbi:MAG: 16S rRNA (cytosine(1402)-N(4))-methyltransferase RsmH [Sulfobacillus thermotolerans]|uniref:Ribosomal RNA small subunit methyltransferase H n=1 Tax=Sulfobacillus thermotolerans TaxID=338644 RepID=A0ABN5H490_9FIRM|nr:16S rRNA (cytosine(1402)-N(4))-methyltransferase [Sulfobacillus thermotolerans]MCY0908308.1 16S rRNA (cytosine(1402)-N(4))-methyltransferase RsmH [Sulfobacillus thermotolerans]